ncbi:MAG: hypothetical protein NTY65_16330 [Planctomycetota bacterium]|nr:hypothetical protein [Planctomycetota bacterium]
MSVMDRTPIRLSDLPPEEIERQARWHVDGFFGEVRAAGEHVRAECHPLNLVRKHPLATAAVIGVAGFAVARLFRGTRRAPRGAAAEPVHQVEGLGRTFGRTLLAGLAGSAARVLPDLVMAYLRRRNGG